MSTHRMALALCALLAMPLRAQGGFLAQGVIDSELWKTDSASRLLARNDGRPGLLGRINLWAAAEPLRDVVLFGHLEAETGTARREEGSEVYLEQYGVRWSPSDALTLQGGKMAHPVGVFSTRHLSFRNPLVGAPDGYSLTYPMGVQLSGAIATIDYRAAVVDEPLWHEGYTPEPSAAPRPAVGVGITPFTGFRIGASATAGPYLRNDLATTLYAGRDWRSYRQRILAGDVQFSRGYLELNAELAAGSYDVPGRAEPIPGLTWYVEGKYTFTPRFYLATRAERNDYPFIEPRTGTVWTASRSDFTDIEVGGGFRIRSSTLLKASVRADHRVPTPNPFAPQASGRAVAVQLSQTFDLVEMATRP